jgi:hypothetical protein
MASQHQTIYGAENKTINEETSSQFRSESAASSDHENGPEHQDLESATRAMIFLS